jgi:hypothetical protein
MITGLGPGEQAHVEAGDVADLGDELRVRAQLPRLGNVGPEVKSTPDPRDRRLRQARLACHLPGRLVTVLARVFLGQNPGDRLASAPPRWPIARLPAP